ncbi:MAG TPA: thioesterase family protein [Streptosporangiaceae bacterium]|nr:thioesterase family protein [Streptosporangiaceae bacterium]
MTIFDQATAVTRRADGLYDALPDARFAIAPPGTSTPPAVNGGALLATVMRAVLSESPLPHPVATSAHFLRVAELAPAQVQVSWLKHGRTASTARAALVQDGQVVLDTTMTVGTVPGPEEPAQAGSADGTPAAGLSWTGPPPGFPAIGDCVDLGNWRGTEGYAAHVEVLMDPATAGWRAGEPSGLPEMRGYMRLRDHHDPDAYLLALAVDGLPPVVFGLGATGWAPTVELTWHMRAVPRPGPLAVACRARHVSGGWFDEEAEVWDSAGRLVAQSRQIARVGRGALRSLANGAAGQSQA